MDRKQFLKVSAMAGAGVMTVGARARATSAAATGKSIIAVVCDDLNKQAVVPGIKRLVGKHGATFNHALGTWPVCCPARVTLFRGQMTHNHKVYYNDGPKGGLGRYRELGYEQDSLPVWLHDAGIVTYLMGKYNNGYTWLRGPGPYKPPGWDHWYAYVGDPTDPHASNNGVVEDIPGHSVDHFADRAESFIKEMAAADQQFFLWISPWAPHRRTEMDPEYADRFATHRVRRVKNFNARGDGEPRWLANDPILTDTQVRSVDAEHRDRLRMMMPVRDLLARIVDTVDDPAVPISWDDVYLFFTTDNAYHEGHHHLMPNKFTPYDEDVNLPLMVRGPGIPAGTVRNQLVANHDIAPTFCDLLGVPYPEWVDGRSFKRLLSADPSPPWSRKFVGIEGWDWNKDHPGIPDMPHYRGVRSGVREGGVIHKFVKYPFYDPPQYEWYRLDLDPYEMHNKWRTGDPPTLDGGQAAFDYLEARTEAIFNASGATLRAAEDGL